MTPTELWWLYDVKVPKSASADSGPTFDLAYEAIING